MSIKSLTSSNGQIVWNSEHPSLEFHAQNKSAKIVFNHLNTCLDFWESLIVAIQKLNDYIDDYEHEDVKDETFAITIESYDSSAENLVIKLFYNSTDRYFTISHDSTLSVHSQVSVDFNLENTWKIWLKILKQMKRDYIKHKKDNTIYTTFECNSDDEENDEGESEMEDHSSSDEDEEE